MVCVLWIELNGRWWIARWTTTKYVRYYPHYTGIIFYGIKCATWMKYKKIYKMRTILRISITINNHNNNLGNVICASNGWKCWKSFSCQNQFSNIISITIYLTLRSKFMHLLKSWFSSSSSSFTWMCSMSINNLHWIQCSTFSADSKIEIRGNFCWMAKKTNQITAHNVWNIYVECVSKGMTIKSM